MLPPSFASSAESPASARLGWRAAAVRAGGAVVGVGVVTGAAAGSGWAGY